MIDGAQSATPLFQTLKANKTTAHNWQFGVMPPFLYI
jgi:hypothetical protein